MSGVRCAHSGHLRERVITHPAILRMMAEAVSYSIFEMLDIENLCLRPSLREKVDNQVIRVLLEVQRPDRGAVGHAQVINYRLLPEPARGSRQESG